MERQDYLLKQASEFARFLAELSGWAKNTMPDNLEQTVNQKVNFFFELPENFNADDLAQSGLDLSELRRLAELLEQKRRLFPENESVNKQLVAVYARYAETNPDLDLKMQGRYAELLDLAR